MTLEDLIAEGRALERPSWFLRAAGEGTSSATWHAPTKGVSRRGLTFDSAFFPNIGCRHISVVSDHMGGGVVECLEELPEFSDGDVPLISSKTSVLPPIDAIFARGSERVASWLTQNEWKSDWGYGPNFPDASLVEQYQRAYQAQHPIYSSSSDVFAMIGGWHFPFPDDDWSDLVDDQLLLMTFQDAEPWVEAWKGKDGAFRVIQRIT